MSKYAYLNSSLEVVSCSDVVREITIPKLVALSVTERIDNAPDVIQAKGLNATYHKKISGDGSDISHYTVIEFLNNLKGEKFRGVDKKTHALIVTGFEYPSSSGVYFSLSIHAQDSLSGLKALSDDVGYSNYPITFNSIDDFGIITVSNAAEAKDFYGTGYKKVRSYLDSGTVLKDSIRSATTVAELDAVVDNR